MTDRLWYRRCKDCDELLRSARNTEMWVYGTHGWIHKPCVAAEHGGATDVAIGEPVSVPAEDDERRRD